MVLTALLSSTVFSINITYAKLPSTKMGDVTLSNGLDITDVTAIQRHLADVAPKLSEYQLFLADVDNDGEVTISDATVIQRVLLDIPTIYHDKKIIELENTNLNESFSEYKIPGSSKTNVELKLNNDSIFTPILYRIEVDGILLQDFSKNNTVTLALSVGKHRIKINLKNKMGEEDERIIDYTIKEETAPTTVPTEKPTTPPTEEPTTVPTEKPTTPPTEEPTTAPTEKPTEAPTEEPTEAEPAFQPNVQELKLLELINSYREKNGAAKFIYDESISKVARLKSEDMSINNYQGHISEKYGYVDEMLDIFDIDWDAAGENIAYSKATAESVFNEWIGSPRNNANLLEEQFNKIGIGYISGSNIWTLIVLKT